MKSDFTDLKKKNLLFFFYFSKILNFYSLLFFLYTRCKMSSTKPVKPNAFNWNKWLQLAAHFI